MTEDGMELIYKVQCFDPYDRLGRTSSQEEKEQGEEAALLRQR